MENLLDVVDSTEKVERLESVNVMGRLLLTMLQCSVAEDTFSVAQSFVDSNGCATLTNCIVRALKDIAGGDPVQQVAVLEELAYLGLGPGVPNVAMGQPSHCIDEETCSIDRIATIFNFSGKKVANVMALQGLVTVFGQVQKEGVQLQVVETFKRIYEAHPWNHLVVQRCECVVQMMDVLDLCPTAVQRSLMGLFEHPIFIHDHISFEELSSLVILLSRVIREETLLCIFESFHKLSQMCSVRFSSILVRTNFLHVVLAQLKTFHKAPGQLSMFCENSLAYSKDVILMLLQASTEAVSQFRRLGGSRAVAGVLSCQSLRFFALMLLQELVRDDETGQYCDFDIALQFLNENICGLPLSALHELLIGIKSIFISQCPQRDLPDLLEFSFSVLAAVPARSETEGCNVPTTRIDVVESALSLVFAACEVCAANSNCLQTVVRAGSLRECLSPNMDLATGAPFTELLTAMSQKTFLPVRGPGLVVERSILSPLALLVLIDLLCLLPLDLVGFSLFPFCWSNSVMRFCVCSNCKN